MPLRKVPLGMSVHNVEMQPGRGGQICRSAGTTPTLTAREGKWAQITLPSGEVRRVSSECRATIGMIGNADHMNISLGKAGRKRWMGRKPHNRGTSHEPGRSSDGGRRRPHRGRPASVQSHRRAWPRAARPQETEAVQLGHHPPPSARTALRRDELISLVALAKRLCNDTGHIREYYNSDFRLGVSR